MNSHFGVKISLTWGFGGYEGLPPLGCRHLCHFPQSALRSPTMVVTTPRGMGICDFNACSPHRTPCTGASSCKEPGHAGWGGPSPPGWSASFTCPEGTGRVGVHCTTPASSRPPPTDPKIEFCVCHCCCRYRFPLPPAARPLPYVALQGGPPGVLGELVHCSVPPTTGPGLDREREGDDVYRHLHHL